MAGSCEYGDEPPGSINAGNFLSSLGPVSFSERTLLHVVSYEEACQLLLEPLVVSGSLHISCI